MKGIATCEDCQFEVTIYRLSVPKKWCEECDLLVTMVKKTISELGIENKTKLIIKPWFLFWWQPLLKHFAWHAPILMVDGGLVSQGTVPDKQTLLKALSKNVVRATEFMNA